MAEPPLEAHDLTKGFGGILAVRAVSLTLRSGETHALIGPNGAGKLTLVNLLAGELRPDAGSVRLLGRDVTRLSVGQRARLGLGRSFQITSVLPSFSVLDNVAIAVQARSGSSFRPLADAGCDPRLSEPASVVLHRVGLAALADRPASVLAHGAKRRLELAMALAREPAVLLLDEPMAGMGPDERAAMVRLLRGLGGSVTMLLVEHNMDAVFALAERISVLVYGRVIATGTPAEIRADPDVRRAYLGDEATAG